MFFVRLKPQCPCQFAPFKTDAIEIDVYKIIQNNLYKKLISITYHLDMRHFCDGYQNFGDNRVVVKLKQLISK